MPIRSTAIERCYTEGVCVGANASHTRTNATSSGRRLQQTTALALDSSSTYGDGLCRAGHTGPFCEECAADHYKEASGLCSACDKNDGSVELICQGTDTMPTVRHIVSDQPKLNATRNQTTQPSLSSLRLHVTQPKPIASPN